MRPVRSLLVTVALVAAGCPEAPRPPEPGPAVAPVVDEAARAAEARLARERAEAEARERAAAAESEARLRAEADARARADADRLAFEQTYPFHGVAFHFLAPVRKEPSDRAPAIGYLRRGSQFRATPRVEGTGCARGWHRLPGDGFVCRGEGVTLGSTPQTFEPSPHPPSLEDALPYPYAYTMRKSAPQYFRIPTLEETDEVARFLARIEAQEQRVQDAGVPTEEGSAVEAPPPPGGTAEVTEGAGVDAGLPGILRMRMQRGFYVSVDGTEEAEDGRRFVRTVRGGYVPEAMLVPNEPPTHRGVALGGSWALPVGFVYRSGAHRLSRDATTGEIVDQGTIPQHTSFVVRERFARGQTGYLVAGDGWVVRETVARVAREMPRPREVPEGAKWIHVDLSEQTLVAYEGDRPVFTTTVSSGREGFATPVGVFRIQSKHVSTTMDDLVAGPEAYSIEDVPWTMYFQGNYALHGAFWHNQFGRVRSHGCVNLAPADARFLFGWSTPTLPASWHGVFATPANAGTFIVVTP